jgi:hypothetical protein
MSGRGGVAILAAFMLLAVLASAALATSRNLARELAMAGAALQGARAAAAAESGLHWFLERCRGEALLDPARDAGEGYRLDAPEALPDEDPPGSALRQGFQLRVRQLGVLPGPGPPERLWQVTATGRCGVPGQPAFTQVRELLVASPEPEPGEEPLRGQRILAWRAVPPGP